MNEASVKVHHFKAHDLPFVSVTVYNDRAEVKRKVTTTIEAGTHEIVIEGIPPTANQNSVRVDGRGAATIHEVQFQSKPALADEVYSPKIKKLEEERTSLKDEKFIKEDLLGVIRKRIEALDEMVIAQLGGVGKREKPLLFTFDDEASKSASKLLAFFEENATKARENLRNVERELEKIDEKIAKLNSEIGHMSSLRLSRNVCILVESEKGGEIELDVSYQVWSARWFPSYDIRVTCNEEGASKMKMAYYGKIVQSTGEDWMDVPLLLSTAQPSLGGNVPELGTLNAVFRRAAKEKRESQLRDASSSESDLEVCPRVCLLALKDEKMSHAPVEAVETVLSTVFSVPRPATIPSDSSEHKVTITIMDLSPKMLHETVPSKNTNVFLMASLINETNYPFLAGEASVYLDNSFVAKTQIKPASPGERFVCSLGVDPGVKVEYKPASKFKEQVGVITKSASVVTEQRIVVKNTKRESILLTVKDHLPKSTDEKIKINLLSPKLVGDGGDSADGLKQGQLPTVGVRLNKANNLEWTVLLKPANEEEFLIKWSVQHPNSEVVEFTEAI